MAKNGNIHPTRIFREPEEMEKAWIGYKERLKTESKNWPKIQYVGKDGDRREDYPILPYTLEGFKRFCRETNIGEISEYFNSREYYINFANICSRIREEIREQQITGGMLGFYNPSITQRLNGLVEKTDNKNENTNIEIKASFGSQAVHPPSEPESNT